MAEEAAKSLGEGLKELNLTNEELNKFEKAFKDPEFLRLFEEYAKEVSDPKVKAETDMYLRQIEEQGRAEEVYGKGVQLITPTAALVIKSKVVGPADASATAGEGGKGSGSLPAGQKVFINVCTSDKVGRYSLQEAKDPSGRVGKTLSIPLTLGPVRAGTDKHGQPASVYDFVVHPDSVEFAAGNPAAFNMLAETALEHVERTCNSKLSRGWRRLNIRYKSTEGCASPPVQSIRTAEGGEAVGGRLRPRADVPGADVPGAKSAPSVAAAGASPAAVPAAAEGISKGSGSRSMFSFDRPKAKANVNPEITDPAQPGYRHADGSVTPEWTLVHRGEADLAAAWKDVGRGLALGSSVPKELLVRVTLPDISSAAAVDLDVGQRVLTLKVPGRYQLSVPLPYEVDESKGRAKLDKARKQLEITLPVVPPPPPPPAPVRPSASLPPARGSEAPQGDGTVPAVTTNTREVPEPAVPAPEPASHGGLDQEPASSLGSTASAPSGAGQGESPTATSGGRAADHPEADAAGPRTGGEEVGGATTSGAVADAGSAKIGKERELTENERKWMEIHARAHADVDAGPATAGSAGAGTQPLSKGQSDGGLDTLAAHAAASQPGGESGSSRAAPSEEAEPTVLLRPRLQCGLWMELD